MESDVKAVFLSDAHLRASSAQSDKLLSFFRDFGKRYDHLFLVGDFFDFWFCRDGRVYPPFRPMAERLVALRDEGVTIYYFEGNHDFFLEEFFGDRGFRVVPEGLTVSLDGKRFYIAHGDTVDRENRSYLRLRRFLRSRFFRALQSRIPPGILWKVADFSSRFSKNYLSDPPEPLVRKMEAFAMGKFQEGCDAVVVGHCHLPILRETTLQGRTRHFVALGDWIRHFSYLEYGNGKFDLLSWNGGATPDVRFDRKRGGAK